jgi:RND family efflux transporter MFP subunit
MTQSLGATSTLPLRLLLLFVCACPTALGVLALAGCTATREEPKAALDPAVTVVKARKMDVPIIGHPNGTTRALHEVTIRARVKGFLTEKHFEEGKNVRKGQLLLVIDEKPFQVQLEQAQAQLAAAKAALEKATASKNRQVAKAKVDLSLAQVRLDEVEERRERSLLTRKAASQDDYDRAAAQRKKSAAQLESDQASSDQAEADYKIDIDSAKADVEKAVAALADAQINLGYCRMYSPIDGRIGELQVKPGNLVGPAAGSDDTTTLVTIEQLHPMGVDVRPASRYLSLLTELVKKGLDVSVRPQGQKPHPHIGRVFFLDNVVDPGTSTVLVRAEVPNPDETLLPGEYVKVDINVGDYAGAIVVPDQAVVAVQEGMRVLTVDAQDKVQVAIVKPIDTYQGQKVIESGLEPEQRVIVEGIQLVRPGQKVKVKEADIQEYVRTREETAAEDPLASPLVRLRVDEAEKSKSRNP